jgi:N-methylhydantoinase A/oxoprolinase/acetone carboxylase beta subunit
MIMGYRIGVDIGGTFTNFGEDGGALQTLRVLSTPDRSGEEVHAAFESVVEKIPQLRMGA